MRKAMMAVAALVFLSGCTALPFQGEASDAPPARGLIIQDARMVDPVVPEGGETELVLRLANTQPDAAEDVGISRANTGDVNLELDDQKSDEETCAAAASGGADVQAAAQGVPTELVCVWDVQALSAEPGTYPVTVAVTYTNTLTMQTESPKITFDPDLGVPAADVARTYSNGEVSLAVSYPPRLPSGTDEFEIQNTVQNTGTGSLDSLSSGEIPPGGDCGDRCAVLSIGQSFSEQFGFAPLDEGDSETRCRLARFLEGENSAETTCRFDSADVQEGSIVTYGFRASTVYRYQRQVEVPLQVLEGQ